MFKHFVITRFNCVLPRFKDRWPDKYNKRLDKNYLNQRFAIFEKYTYKSIICQSNKNFEWIILFDDKTSDEYLKRVKCGEEDFAITPLLISEEDNAIECLDDYIFNNTKYVDYYITSRVDNDDMYSSDYIETVQKFCSENGNNEYFISFPYGLQYDLDKDELREYIRKDNHFTTHFSGKKDGNLYGNIMNINHTKLYDIGAEIKTINTDNPMWLEIIHESNCSNRKITEEILDRDDVKKIMKRFYI